MWGHRSARESSRTDLGERVPRFLIQEECTLSTHKGYSVFFFTFKGKKKDFFLPFQDLASLEKVKKLKILPFSTHQNLKISEIRAKIKGKMLKTSNIKQKFRLRRAKSVKNNLNTSISILKKSPPEGRRFFLPFLKSKKNTGKDDDCTPHRWTRNGGSVFFNQKRG